MSLLRQLWLSVSTAMLIILLGTLVVSVFTARGYLEQQLLTQASDGASSLGLSITQQGTDPGTVETLVNATFDSGHFRIVRYVKADGSIGVERGAEPPAGEVPDWFMTLFPLHAQPGTALVSHGWNQAGSVFIQSHTQFAHEALWNGSLVMAAVLGSAGALWAIAITLLMKRIRRPLDSMADQARRIGEGEFLTVPETDIVELKDIGIALNFMSERVKTMFAEQATRIAELQNEVSRDTVTGLTNRNFFMGELRNALSDEAPPTGVLTLIRIRNLLTLNKELGRAKCDGLLKSMAAELNTIFGALPDTTVARMNGSDFAILTQDTHKEAVATLAHEWRTSVEKLGIIVSHTGDTLADVAITQYQRPEMTGGLLSRADAALMQAESTGDGICMAQNQGTQQQAVGEAVWGEILRKAIAEQSFKLEFYSVIDGNRQLIHQEGMLRLITPSEPAPVSAGRFMPAAIRLGLIADCDLITIELALKHIRESGDPVAMNLAPQTLLVPNIHSRMEALFMNYPQEMHKLSIEVSERGLDEDAKTLEALGKLLAKTGGLLGIEHFGRKLSVLPQLYALNVSYLKIDGSVVHCLHENNGNQRLVKAIVDMASGLGVKVIAEQVHDNQEWAALAKLGVVGLTGPETGRMLSAG